MMTGCKIPREISCARMNGEGVVIENCAASPNGGLVHPLRHRRGNGGNTIEFVRDDYNNLRTVHINEIIGDKYVNRTNRLHRCYFITRRIAVTVQLTTAQQCRPRQAPAVNINIKLLTCASRRKRPGFCVLHICYTVLSTKS